MTRKRGLSAEERALWAEVVRSVAPLAGRRQGSGSEAGVSVPPEPAEAAADALKEAARSKAAPAPPPTKAPRAPAPLAPFERKIRLALRRGTRMVDARIDLHGLRQDDAHAALLGFLRRSHAAGHGLVLVVTGKGAGAAEWSTAERGVLRRMVPHWLRLPDVRPLVLGFEEAPPRLGGAGALYVRLRRHRPERRW